MIKFLLSLKQQNESFLLKSRKSFFGCTIFFMVMFFSFTASASHFRYGSVTATRLSETVTTVTYRLNVSLAWQTSPAASISFAISGGNTGSVSVIMTNTNDPGGWINGTGTSNVTLNKTATLTRLAYTGGAKISNLSNNANGSWNIYTVINTGAGGSSPVSTLPAIINMPINAAIATYTIPASDPDPGSTLTYGFATIAGLTQPAGLTINATTGQLTWDTRGKSLNQLYNALVTVRDNDGNEIMLDFIIKLVGESNPPQFDYTINPANGAIYTVLVGQNISFPIKASDSDVGSKVSLSVSGLPSYITAANFSPALPAVGNPSQTTFSWTPTAAQVGNTVVLNYIATDNVGVQSSTSVTIKVAAEPAPLFLNPTPLQGSITQIVTGLLHQDTITAQSTIGSNVSIAFATGIPSGASLSPVIPTLGANPGKTILSWTPTPADFGTKNLTFQAVISSAQTIFSTRNYSLVVNTPPVFSSAPILTPVTTGTNFNYDVVINDPDIPYGDIVDVAATGLPSWLTLVSTGNGKAKLSGTPSLSDLGNYHISLEAQDTYHHGNPNESLQEFDITVISPKIAAGALNFDGQNDYVSVNEKASLNNLGKTGFTLESWIKVVNPNEVNSIIRKTGDYNLYINNGKLCAEVWPNGADNDDWKIIIGNTNITPNSWVHVAFTWDGLTPKLFVNGTSESITVNTGSIAGYETLFIGYSSIFNQPLQGGLDELRIWDRALCQGEIQNNLNAELALPQIGLLAYFKMNQGFVNYDNSGENTLTDLSGNNNTGTLTNFALAGATSNWADGTVTGTSLAFTPPVASFTANGPLTFCPSGSVILSANAGTDLTYQWTKDGVNIPSANLASYTANTTGSYNVIVTKNGCTALAEALNVSVVDSIAPVKPILADITGQCFVTVTNKPTTTDNCAGTITGTTTSPLTYVAQGNYVIVWKFDDGNGNVTTANQNVIVKDDITPVFVTVNNISVSTSTTTNNALVTVPTPVIADNCEKPTGNSLAFDGLNDIVSVSQGLPSMTEMTIETWLKPKELSNWDVIMNYNTFNIGDIHFQFYPNKALGFSIAGNNPTDQLTSLTFDNKWYHFAVVYSATGKYVKFYLNGNLIDTRTYTTAIATAANKAFSIGGWAPDNRYFNGNLDDLRIWNVVRTAEEIKVSMNSTLQGNETGLLAYYDFNQGVAGGNNATVTSVTDLAGGNNTGTLQNFALTGSTSNWASGAPTTGISLVNDFNNSSDASGIYPAGSRVINWTATDAAGNKAFAQQTITVIDSVKPIVLTKNITVAIDATGNAVITPAQVNNGTSDNSGNFTLSLDKTTFDCSNLGANLVTLTATDANGNKSTNTNTSGLIGFWDFKNANPLKDQTGTWGDLLITGNASISNGKLDVNNGGMARTTSYTGATIGNKTLISYLSLDDLNLRAGSALTIDKINSDAFDGIIYAEGQPNRWMNGSSNALRYQALNPGFAESKANQLIQVALTYEVQPNNQVLIKFYRNGVAYGSYTSNNFQTWSANDAEMIFGARHFLNGTQIGSLDAKIEKAMIFNRALSIQEIQQLNTIVTVEDKIAPTIASKPISVTLTASGTVSITPQDVLLSGTDNCSGTITYSLSKSTFGATDAINSPITIQLIGTDASGNATSVPVLVTVIDPVPVVITRNITVALGANGNVTITPQQIDNGSNSVVGLLSEGGLVLDKTTFDCSNIGVNTVTLTVTSSLGSKAFATAIVTVIDTIKPIVLVQNKTIQLNEAGTASISAADINNGSTDNCSIATIVLDKTIFTGANIGPNTITLTVTDINGNISTATAIITVEDKIAPIITSTQANVIVALDANNGTAGLTDYTSLAAATDNSGGVVVITQSPVIGTSLVQNVPLTVTLTATDASGNFATQTFTVTATDQTAPIALAKNITVQLDATGNVVITPQQVDNGSTDNVGIVNYVLNKSTFNCEDVSVNTISDAYAYKANRIQGTQNWPGALGNDFKVNNPNGIVINKLGAFDDNQNGIFGSLTGGSIRVAIFNRQTQTIVPGLDVMISGTNQPLINGFRMKTISEVVLMPGDYSVVALGFNSNERNGNFLAPLSTTNNGSGAITFQGTGRYNNSGFSYPTILDGGPVNRYDAGTFSYSVRNGNEVTLTVTDASGNTSFAKATVTIEDKIAPIVITQNKTIQLDAAGNATITATDINNGSTDNCSIATVLLSKVTFDCSNVGANTVTLTVTDVNGNVSTATAVVTVEDKIAPIVITQNKTIQLNAAGTASITAADINNGSTDNCSIASIVLSKIAFDCSNVGANTVTLTVTDINGNVSTATAVVTVEDQIAPIVLTQNKTIQLNAAGTASITAADINNGSTDNCSIATVVLSKTAFDCSNVGSNTVTLTVTDVNGNVSTATAVITVEDKIAPIVLTQNKTIQLNAAGTASITAADINNGSTDNCSIASIALSKTAFDCSNVGANTVTLTVTDVNGNVSTKTAIVTVEDKIAPMVLTQNKTIQLNAAGIVSVTAADINNGSTDNCSIASIALSKTAFDCSNVGANTVTLTVTDVNGNVSTKTAVVTVEDKIAPIVTQLAFQEICFVASNTYSLPTLIATDNCSIASVAFVLSGATSRMGSGTNPSGTLNTGLTTITWTVKDVNGNVSTSSNDIRIWPLPVLTITPSNADAFCNEVSLSPSSSIPVVAYRWMFNNSVFSTSAVLKLSIANADGNYQLFVTDIHGCVNTQIASYNFQKQGNISSYTILGLREIKLGENNSVLSGSVGAMGYKGKIDIKKNSSVAAAGAFVKAADIKVQSPSNIPTKIYAPVVTSLPTMQYFTGTTKYLTKVTASSNTTLTGNYKEVIVKAGKAVTLTGNLFGKIEIEEGATVTFTSSIINIEDLDVDGGESKSKYTPSYTNVIFSTDAVVKVSDNVDIENRSNINPTGKKVVFYVGSLKDHGKYYNSSHSDDDRCPSRIKDHRDDDDDDNGHEGEYGNGEFTVNGGESIVNVSVYVPTGKIKVKGGEKLATYMTGTFIADKIESTEKNVNWNGFSCSANMPTYNAIAVQSTNTSKDVLDKSGISLSVIEEKPSKLIAYPNPFSVSTTISFRVPYSESNATLDIYDVRGVRIQNLFKGSANANQDYEVKFDGSNIAAGAYFLRLSTSKEVKDFKVVMTN